MIAHSTTLNQAVVEQVFEVGTPAPSKVKQMTDPRAQYLLTRYEAFK